MQTFTDKNEFITGADISTLQQIEDFGGKVYEKGIQRKCMDILQDRGFNYIRLKVWNNPGLPNSDPAGYNNKEHTLQMAKRIKDMGFKLLIDFHYSDFWADPQVQTKPAAWEGLKFEGLNDAVYEYTKEVITALKAQGTLPEMVQIGNEISNGFLWDDGKLDGINATDAQWDKFCQLLKSGIRGLKDSLGSMQDVKIMIHIDKGGDFEFSKNFYDHIISREVEFDVIGQSYYSQWHGTIADLEYTLNSLAATYNKELVVVETAYPWTPKSDSNMPNKVTVQLDGYPATVDGQAKFIRDVIKVIKNVPDNKGTGLFYWEPAFITVEGCGWKYGEGNEWGNMTLFDFEGNLLDSIQAFKEEE
ncbi:MAG: arabinogalactan endo-1,4-beta-galactosidase [Clostridia bacterium]|nr:arabinogalactan endo-1,4-beta-galactosidase [Clostridia bacterium]